MVSQLLTSSRRVLLLCIEPPSAEFLELCETAGLVVDLTVQQRRDRPHPRHFIGSGKMQEVAQTIAAHGDLDLVVAADELRPGQIFELERSFQLPVWDRIRLLLEIFQSRAGSQAARLQVEMAQLDYEIPLVRELVNRSKTGERLGAFAGGRVGTDVLLSDLRRRWRKVRKQLSDLNRRQHATQRQRLNSGALPVALAGYTNAGKTSIFNSLTGQKGLVEGRMFSTVTTTTRRVTRGRQHGHHPRLVITDSVGFIEELPPLLVSAFQATVESVLDASIILLVVDIGQDLDKLQARMELGLRFLTSDHTPPLIVVANKVDTVEDAVPALRFLELGWPFPVFAVSAHTGEGIERLVDHLISMGENPAGSVIEDE